MRNLAKPLYIYIIGVVCTVMAVVGFEGCTSSPDAKDYKIGVSQPSGDDWRQTMNDEIRREVLFHTGVSVEILSADNSNAKQQADLRHFIDEGVDLIIVSPNEPEPLAPLVREARQKGIEVISFDRRIEDPSAGPEQACTMHVEVDNEALGHEVADYALSLFPHGARILEIEGNLHTSPATGRHKGFADGIAAHPEMQIVASLDAGWRLERSKELADSFLRKNPNIDLVFAHSDGMAVQTAAVAKSLGLNDIKYLGIDGIMNVGIKAVTDSVLTATFLYPTYGYLLLRQAIDVLDGKPYEKEIILPPVSAVDLHNADILRQQVKAQYEETEKIIQLRDKLSDFLAQYNTQKMLLGAAILIVLIVIVLIIVLIRTLRHDRQHQRVLTEKNAQLELEKQKQEALYEQLADATQAKLMFFTNVSHDLRTPLTLIAEPINQLCAAPNLTEQQMQLMDIAGKNIRTLRRLIDQILDFRKYESGKTTLRLSEVSIYPQLQEWAQSFELAARKQGMTFSIMLPVEHPSNPFSMAIDVEKIERVVFNIVSNAFKYTDNGGTITIEAHNDAQHFTLSVRDTGRGINPDDLRHIFENFYRAESKDSGISSSDYATLGMPTNPSHPVFANNGSGIGLALTKAFVELHGGTITVDSTPGEGSTFSIMLPITHVDELTEPTMSAISEDIIDTDLKPLAESEETDAPSDDKPLLLVIDDNADILRLVKMLLGDEYSVLTAADGQRGLQTAIQHVPNIILCDVMMPVMDGMECCRELKRNIATSHIPVLMLTACSLDEQRIQGYDSGADGYMSKPFNAAVLKSRLRNLIDNRKRLTPPAPRTGGADTTVNHTLSHNEATTPPARGAGGGGGGSVPSLPVGKIDSQFYNRVLEILNREYRNPDLSIEQIASHVGLSQSQFSRKVKALTNYTPVELIKRFRVQMGHQLLTTTDKTIAEIAYEVGFSDPNYFSKCHKNIYGETPTELRIKQKV